MGDWDRDFALLGNETKSTYFRCFDTKSTKNTKFDCIDYSRFDHIEDDEEVLFENETCPFKRCFLPIMHDDAIAPLLNSEFDTASTKDTKDDHSFHYFAAPDDSQT